MYRMFSIVVFFIVIALGGLGLVRCEAPTTTPDGGNTDAPAADKAAGETFSFPAATAASCGCTAEKKYETPHSPSFTGEASAIAASPDGKVLLIGAKTTVSLFKRDAADANFTDPASSATLTEDAQRIQFSPDGKHVAIITGYQVLVWSVEKALVDPKDAVVAKIEAPGKGEIYTADAAFYANDIIAVAMYGGTAKDEVQLWSLGADAKQLLTLQAQAAQSLAMAPQGGFLVVGGREAIETDPRGLFTVFKLSGDKTGVTEDAKQEFFLAQKNTNVTTVAVSPDNKYIAAGTSPDILVMRALPKPPPQGEHAYISIWSTSPLKADTGILLKQADDTQKAHNIMIRRLAFRSDGKMLASLGVGSPRNSARLHLWAWQDNADQPFVLSHSLEVTTPGRDMSFGAPCDHVFNASVVEPYAQMWKGCK